MTWTRVADDGLVVILVLGICFFINPPWSYRKDKKKEDLKDD